MTDPQDLKAFEVVAAAADAQADEMDKAEQFTLEVADLIAKQNFYRQEMKKARFDRMTIAHAVAAMGPEWWWNMHQQKGKK
jgi:hypothetical protein